MKYQLSGAEARVVGCLLEKQVTTPEQYPLSVNAVMMACNQKTNREPVMNLSEHDVQDVLDELVKRHICAPSAASETASPSTNNVFVIPNSAT